ncbi:MULTISPECIES: hypothetical protein [unclassified Pseudomonas]|uniref:hypothetical protein n=1 Tax=unclassified Pseudomonas TaxID=196821 RepID=UPI0021BB5CC5|nr:MULTISPECIES: hypothetical protein [unclassified Pseudomonas]MCT8164986.1 hypothetical protein [Pseudomonas sp. HD6422]MCT8183884.1 hypothetical protein [Pseudomonas sp. HD6421]
MSAFQRLGGLMKAAKDLFEKLKAKHWDKKPYSYSDEHFAMFGFDSPPLRRAWESHGSTIKKVGIWLLALIAGGVITKLIGLS